MRILYYFIFAVMAINLFGVFLALVFGTYLSIKNGNGSIISAGGNGREYKEIIKEDEKCVYYVDIYGYSDKTCGCYSITQ